MKLNQKVLIQNVLKLKVMEHVQFKLVKRCKKLKQKVRLVKFKEIKFRYFLEENQITMTYEVEWAPSETRWASRYVYKIFLIFLNKISSFFS